MANLGLCRKHCDNCNRLYRGIIDGDGRKLSSAQIWCTVNGGVPVAMEWDSEVPDHCPYALEHLISKDAVADLAEESQDFRAERNEELR